MERGSGRTTKQMEGAPQNSVFVWVNGHTKYPERLAKKIGRDDLKIVTPYWLESNAWRGCRFTGVAVDHAAHLTNRQRDGLQGLLLYVIDA